MRHINDTDSHYPFRYTLYGLTLACNTRLAAPGLYQDPVGAAARPVDVLVDLVGIATPEMQMAAPEAQRIVEVTGGWLGISHFVQCEGDWTRLRFGYAEHRVQFDIAPAGTLVVVTWTPAVLSSHVCTLLFGTVMNYLLYTQGRLALHASVVAWKDVAFCFIGGQGAGKSTTVSALIQRGCTVVSDDIAALTWQPGGWAVFPGLTGIRLTPQAQAALGIPADATTPLWSRLPQVSEEDYQKLVDKTVVSFAETQDALSMAAPLPLAGLFLLPPRSDSLTSPHIIALSAAAALPRLTEHLLTPAWLKPTMDQERFRTLVDLARHTSVRLVERPNRLAALPQFCDALLDEMKCQTTETRLLGS